MLNLREKKIEARCISLALAALVIGIVIGLGAGITLNSGIEANIAETAQLEIQEIEWGLEDDYLTIYITVGNNADKSTPIHSISVRRNVAGSVEYVWPNPTSVHGHEAVVAGGATDTFA